MALGEGRYNEVNQPKSRNTSVFAGDFLVRFDITKFRNYTEKCHLFCITNGIRAVGEDLFACGFWAADQYWHEAMLKAVSKVPRYRGMMDVANVARDRIGAASLDRVRVGTGVFFPPVSFFGEFADTRDLRGLAKGHEYDRACDIH